MKRAWTTPEFKRQQRIRQSRANRHRERLRPRQPQPRKQSRASRRQFTISAPEELSLFDEPEPTVRFCNDFRDAISRRSRRVFLDLWPVKRFSSDALLVMRAIMDGENSVGGNMPADGAVASKLRESGFFADFAKTPGRLPPPKGLMLRKTMRRVDSGAAAELVAFSVQHANVPRQMAIASYRTLVEAMTNTHNHAVVREDVRSRVRFEFLRPWFASVYCEANVAYFTFVDLGVGILMSAPSEGFLKVLGVRRDQYGAVQLLQDVFRGKVASSTGLPGRGKGLPRMLRDARAGLLHKLQVATSSVVGEVSDLRFRKMDVSLRGTVLRWQVGSGVQNHAEDQHR